MSDNSRYVSRKRRPQRVAIARDRALPFRIKAITDTCEYCGWKPPEARLLHVHHVTALAAGGSDTPDNIVVLCPNHHALAHYATSRAFREHCGPATRAELFSVLAAPCRPSANMDKIRAIINTIRPTDASGYG